MHTGRDRSNRPWAVRSVVAAGSRAVNAPPRDRQSCPTDPSRRAFFGFFGFGLALASASASPPSDQSAGRPRLPAFHDVVDLRGVDGFVLHQRVLHQLQPVAILIQDLFRPGIAFVDNPAHLAINRHRGIHRHRFGLMRRRTAEENLAFILGVQQGPEFIGQSPFGYHVAGHFWWRAGCRWKHRW